MTIADIRRLRLALRIIQLGLIVIFLAAIWLSGQIALWQKLLATALALILVGGGIRGFRRNQG